MVSSSGASTHLLATHPLSSPVLHRLLHDETAAFYAKPASEPVSLTLLRARFAGLALLRPISLNARQQFVFQPSLALPEPLNLRLESREPLETIEKLDDGVVLVTKRIEACVCRH